MCVRSCGPLEYNHAVSQPSAISDIIWVFLHWIGASHGYILRTRINERAVLNNVIMVAWKALKHFKILGLTSSRLFLDALFATYFEVAFLKILHSHLYGQTNLCTRITSIIGVYKVSSIDFCSWFFLFLWEPRVMLLQESGPPWGLYSK